MIHQLRMYEIFDHNKDAFHARFRDHAVRIMRRHGFHIVDMWETRDEKGPFFVYLLVWPDTETKERAWAAFLSDEEWVRIKRETAAAHGELVGTIADRTLARTDYSPAKV
ncbi:MAG: NIPSNAP family protein [Chloroflexota bacterium]|nr:NIPSNAP family protein [Chloroflexota bacterium]MDE3192200.1 NIPSNAP family protein [Chloroflexota bacterium]